MPPTFRFNQHVIFPFQTVFKQISFQLFLLSFEFNCTIYLLQQFFIWVKSCFCQVFLLILKIFELFHFLASTFVLLKVMMRFPLFIQRWLQFYLQFIFVDQEWSLHLCKFCFLFLSSRSSARFSLMQLCLKDGKYFFLDLRLFSCTFNFPLIAYP